ncbi:MAG: GMC family oxidoreductase N-terminal domain-containing protein [Bacteroidota bacterium]
MLKLSPRQRAALEAVCQTIVPPLQRPDDPDAYWARSPRDLGTADRIIEVVGQLSDRDRKEMEQVLAVLASPLVGLTWWGPLKGIQNLRPEQRQTLLQKWSRHPIADLRKGFNALKKLVGLYYYGDHLPTGPNPNWKRLSYTPLSPSDTSVYPDLEITDPTRRKEWTADVVIVGSGAGGGVAAAVLAAAGQRVIIVEKGVYRRHREYNQREMEMINTLYEGKGLLTSVDGGVTVLAGNCLGGGTTVNWAGAFRTPDYVLREWAEEHGNPHFLHPDYQEGFDFVERRNAVTTELLRHNPQNAALYEGAERLGYRVKDIPRNMKARPGLDPEQFWRDQGFSPLGDANGSKQGSVETFLRDALAQGAQIMTETEVEKVWIENGVATGILARHGNHQLRIRAKRVVVAAGSIHSPALLRRSGLQHREIGRNLYLHPTVAVAAHYDHPVEAWYGPMMSAVCDEFTRLDGNWGCKLETPPVHPGLMAAATSWESGEAYKEEMLRVAQMGTFIVLTRDKHGGEIRLDKKGEAQIHYRLSDYDRQHLIRGMQEACRIHRAAGAQRIGILHNQPLYFSGGTDEDFERFVAQIPRLPWTLNHYGLFSAHQMGTCRMGGSDRDHPLRPNGETREVPKLYVADASAFPSASGANPMLSIQALAYHVARGIVRELGVKILPSADKVS